MTEIEKSIPQDKNKDSFAETLNKSFDEAYDIGIDVAIGLVNGIWANHKDEEFPTEVCAEIISELQKLKYQ